MQLIRASTTTFTLTRIHQVRIAVILQDCITSWSIAPSLVLGHLGPVLWSDAAARDGRDVYVIGWRNWRPSALSALGGAAHGSFDIDRHCWGKAELQHSNGTSFVVDSHMPLLRTVSIHSHLLIMPPPLRLIGGELSDDALWRLIICSRLRRSQDSRTVVRRKCRKKGSFRLGSRVLVEYCANVGRWTNFNTS